MTASELIQQLQKCNPDAQVILAAEPGGESFQAASVAYEAAAEKEEGDSDFYDIGILALTPELEAKGYSIDHVLPNGKPAVVISP